MWEDLTVAARFKPMAPGELWWALTGHARRRLTFGCICLGSAQLMLPLAATLLAIAITISDLALAEETML